MPGEGITLRGLQAAIALVTAANAGLEISQERLLGDTPAEEALRAMTGLASTFLNFGDPRMSGATLRGVGGVAARFETEGTVE